MEFSTQALEHCLHLQRSPGGGAEQVLTFLLDQQATVLANQQGAADQQWNDAGEQQPQKQEMAQLEPTADGWRLRVRFGGGQPLVFNQFGHFASKFEYNSPW